MLEGAATALLIMYQTDGPKASIGVPHLEGHDDQNRAFESLHLFEYLEQDDRPAFVLDLDAPPESNPIYWNPILRRNKGLRDRILGLRKLYNLRETLRHSADWNFLQWQLAPDLAGHARSCRYGQSYWIALTLRSRWRVITSVLAVQNLPSEAHAATSANSSRSATASHATSPDEFQAPEVSRTPTPRKSKSHKRRETSAETRDHPKLNQHGGHHQSSAVALESGRPAKTSLAQEPPSYFDPTSFSHEYELIEDDFLTRPRIQDKRVAIGSFDWTKPDPTVVVTPFVKFFRNFDWASTSLGPIETWSNALRSYVLMLMADPRPAAMFVGPKNVIMYNEGYRFVIGSKHPFMLGKPFDEGWAELGDAFEPAFHRAAQRGLATQRDDGGFFLERANFIEETFFRLSMIPLALDSASESAVYNPISETTQQVITERRMNLLLSVSAELAGSKEPQEFWNSLQRALEQSLHEVPFALMYSARRSLDEELSTSEKNITRERWVREGSIAYPMDTLACIPQILTDRDATQDFIPDFIDLIHDLEPTLLRRSDGSLPQKLIENVKSRAWGDRCETALLIPIRSTGETVLGFLLLGIDPRRPYDDDYVVFIRLLTRQLSATMASAVLFQDEIRTSRTALSDRDKLSEKAQEAEQRFRRMADMAPVAMFHFDETGMPIYCNDMWYAITEHPRGAEYPMSWYNVIHPDDHAFMDEEWAKLGAGASVSFEIRLRKPFKAADAEVVGGEVVEGDTWILAAAYSQKREDGSISSIMGCLTDISRQKWAEDFQNRRKKEALEMKRQQEK